MYTDDYKKKLEKIFPEVFLWSLKTVKYIFRIVDVMYKFILILKHFFFLVSTDLSRSQ